MEPLFEALYIYAAEKRCGPAFFVRTPHGRRQKLHPLYKCLARGAVLLCGRPFGRRCLGRAFFWAAGVSPGLTLLPGQRHSEGQGLIKCSKAVLHRTVGAVFRRRFAANGPLPQKSRPCGRLCRKGARTAPRLPFAERSGKIHKKRRQIFSMCLYKRIKIL